MAIVLGVLALGAHGDLPEHHDKGGHMTVCVAALAIAGLTILRMRRRRLSELPMPWLVLLLPLLPTSQAPPSSSVPR